MSSAQGRLGLLSDLLESARVVTSSGGLVTASRDENPDLFWGLRGAGANLGVVANATFALPRAINAGVVTNSNFLFKVTAAQAVFEVLASFDSMLPAELALNVATFAPWTTGEVRAAFNFLTVTVLNCSPGYDRRQRKLLRPGARGREAARALRLPLPASIRVPGRAVAARV